MSKDLTLVVKRTAWILNHPEITGVTTVDGCITILDKVLCYESTTTMNMVTKYVESVTDVTVRRYVDFEKLRKEEFKNSYDYKGDVYVWIGDSND